MTFSKQPPNAISWKDALALAGKKAPFSDSAAFDELLSLEPTIPAEGHAEYFFLLGLGYGNTKNSKYNPSKSKSFLEHAVELGSTWAMNALGHGWATGAYGVVNEAQAMQLLKQAHDGGHPAAASQLFDLMVKDPRFQNDKTFMAQALDIIMEAALAGSYPGMLKAAKAFASSGDFSISLGFYERLVM